MALRIGTGQTLNLICSYWCPTDPIKDQIGELKDNLKMHPFGETIIIGDFNCRLGADLGGVDKEIPFNYLLNRSRKSRDDTESSRGKQLAKMIAEEGLIIINGRTKSDPHGDFTFVSAIGRSLVDLVLCTLPLSNRVIDGGFYPLHSNSDHFPVYILIESQQPDPFPATCDLTPPTLRWKPELKIHFNANVQDRLYSSLNYSQYNSCSSELVTSSIWASASDLNLKRNVFKPRSESNPWFNKSCSYFKQCLRASLKTMRKESFNEQSRLNYIFLQKVYERVRIFFKDQYIKGITESILNAKDSKSFWSGIRKITPRRAQPEDLQMEAIETHFKNVLSNETSPNATSSTNYFINENTQLNTLISLEELNYALQKCKTGKSPGSDGIPYEFYVNLNFLNRVALLNALNSVLESQQIPPDWCKLHMFLLYKKGDPSIAANYRGISLINCIAKIFTSIIATRISNWAEMSSLLPESQAGFRPERGCADHIFTFLCAIHEQTRWAGNNMYCAFVDFKQAFDCIDHSRLWAKLASFGLSNKIISVIASFYREASVTVTHNGQSSTPIKIRNGVLQGDCLSPLLFAIFIADFESFCEARGIKGVGMGHEWDIKALFYADDLVIFSYSKAHLQAALNALNEYCKINSLCVNTSKTKITIFNNRSSPRPSFSLGESTIEVVKSYTYLGVTFTENGRFPDQIKAVKFKVALAASETRKLICSLQYFDQNVHYRLFLSKICSTLLYGAEFWAIWSVEEVESIQLRYLKNLFLLPHSTPGHTIRSYFSIEPLICQILKKCLKWHNRVKQMPEERYPVLCMRRLDTRKGSTDFNWLLRVQSLLKEAGVDPLPNSRTGLYDVDATMARIKHFYFMIDYNRAKSSSHATLYGSLIDTTAIRQLNMNLTNTRLALQVLLQNVRFQALLWRGQTVKFAPLKPCSFCREPAYSLEHVIVSCPSFSRVRARFGLSGQESLLNVIHSSGIDPIVRFIKEIWRRVLEDSTACPVVALRNA